MGGKLNKNEQEQGKNAFNNNNSNDITTKFLGNNTISSAPETKVRTSLQAPTVAVAKTRANTSPKLWPQCRPQHRKRTRRLNSLPSKPKCRS